MRDQQTETIITDAALCSNSIMVHRRIRLSYSFHYFPLLRQTPGGKGVWGNCQFVTDADKDICDEPYDGWVVYNNLAREVGETILCPRNGTILLVGEPPSRTDISPAYAAQFSKVLTCNPRVRHPGVVRAQQALPWWVGIRRTGRFEFEATMGYDELKLMTEIPKTHELSVVCSDLTITPYHRRRVEFVKALANHFGNRIALYGDGFDPIPDKWDAIAPFKYHIVLENSLVNDYWTEKLADAYLSGALPIYCGCPNIEQYFPSGSFTRIDINRPLEAIQVIERLLAEDPYEFLLGSIWEARRRVLDEYNIFAVISRIVENLPKNECESITLHPSQAFPPSLSMRLRRYSHLAREVVGRSLFKATRKK